MRQTSLNFFLSATDNVSMSVNPVSKTQILEIKNSMSKKSGESSADRDPNGQSSQEHKKHKFTEEEIKDAVSKIQKLEGIKQNNLSVSYEQKGYIYVVYVRDMTGKVVRRISEQDLPLYLQQDESKPSGHILNKAM